MSTTTAHADVWEALAAFQDEAPAIPKNRRGRGQDGDAYSYADLADVTAAARPVMRKHGLVFAAAPQVDEAGQVVRALLRHLASRTEMPGTLRVHGRHMQDVGSGITYARRYLMSTMLGLITEDDDDGAAAAGGAVAERVMARRSGEHAPGGGEPSVAAVLAALEAASSVDELNGLYERCDIGAAPESLRAMFAAKVAELGR